MRLLGRHRLTDLGGVSLGSPTDGQVLIYDLDLGLWVAGTPIAAGKMIDYAENVTGTATTATSTTPADIPNCNIVVPPTTGEVWIMAAVNVSQSVVGTGVASAAIIETTGAEASLNSVAAVLPNTTASLVKNMGVIRPMVRVGPTNVQRTFKLRLSVSAASGTPSVQASNLSTFGGLQSWIKAWAE